MVDALPGSPHVLRVLVVEDDRDCRDSIELLVKRSGHAVCAVENGLSGLAALVDFRPDVAIVDIGLDGGMDGHEFARRVRAATGNHGPYLIAFSGWGAEEVKAQAMSAGFDRYLQKIGTLDELKISLGAVAARNRDRPPRV